MEQVQLIKDSLLKNFHGKYMELCDMLRALPIGESHRMFAGMNLDQSFLWVEKALLVAQFVPASQPEPVAPPVDQLPDEVPPRVHVDAAVGQ